MQINYTAFILRCLGAQFRFGHLISELIKKVSEDPLKKKSCYSLSLETQSEFSAASLTGKQEISMGQNIEVSLGSLQYVKKMMKDL